MTYEQFLTIYYHEHFFDLWLAPLTSFFLTEDVGLHKIQH